MLHFLILFNVLAEAEVLAEEGFMSSPDTLTDATRQAHQLQKDAQELIKKHPINHNLEGLNSKKCCSFQSKAGKENANQRCITNKTPLLLIEDRETKILMFVSFSMPEASLKSLFQETQKHNAVLIMRGLYQGGFMQTAQKLQELGITIDINPELFETYNITSVPTFILLKNSHPTHMLRGNVTLEFATQKLKSKQFNGLQLKERAP